MYLQDFTTTYDVLCQSGLSFDYGSIPRCMELCNDEPPTPDGVSNDIPATRHHTTYGYWEESVIRYRVVHSQWYPQNTNVSRSISHCCWFWFFFGRGGGLLLEGVHNWSIDKGCVRGVDLQDFIPYPLTAYMWELSEWWCCSGCMYFQINRDLSFFPWPWQYDSLLWVIRALQGSEVC